MAAATKNILIFGATGLIGTYITNAIVASKSKFGRVVVFVSLPSGYRRSALLRDD